MLRDREYERSVAPEDHERPTRDGHALARGGLEIGFFSPNDTAVDGSPYRLLANTLGIIGSVLLHTALLTTALSWPASRKPAHPLADSGSGSGAANDAEMEWVSLDRGITLDSSPSWAITPPSPFNPTLQKLNVDLKDLAADFIVESAFSSESEVDPVGEVRFTQYLGQVNARIDRAWLRPRAPIGDDSFVCQVRIEQDTAGKVTEVTLERCNGSPRWQLSLVQAIESASPLPAPPDPALLVHEIHLRFQAQPNEADRMVDQYEPVSAQAIQQVRRASR